MNRADMQNNSNNPDADRPIRNSCNTAVLIPAFFVITLFSGSIAQSTDNGLYFSQAIGGSYNPLGIILDSRLYYKAPVVRKAGMLWESTNIQAGMQNEWTPADNVASARFSIEPIAFFDVVCKAGVYNLYNLLGYGCFRLDSPKVAYGPDAQRNLKRDNARGYWISIAPTLKAKVWRLIVLNTATLDWLGINGSGYFLEVRSYLPHRTNDFDIINEAYLLAECSPWLMAGATYRYAYVTGTALRSQRLCAIAIVKPTYPALKSTYAAVTAGIYPQDPLFNHTFFVGCLVGADFRLAGSSSGKDKK
jgi:hypothetical protein